MKQQTKAEQLWKWCKKNKYFSSAQVERYAVEHFYLRAMRTIRDWCSEGKLYRLNKTEKIENALLKAGMQEIGWYSVI